MTNAFDLTQTLVAWIFAAGRGGDAWGDRTALTDFFAKALGGGGTWQGGFGSSDNPPPATHTVTGFLQSVGNRLAGQDWQVTWGPCVFKDPIKNCLANGMFVVYSPSQKVYAVVISGTNFISPFAALEEDFDNRPENMVNFPVHLNPVFAVPHRDGNDTSRPQLTGGTATGVNVLCAHMHDAGGRDLITYLKGVQKTAETKLVFAGHSLAGALAPALALQLLDDLERAGWSRSNVRVLALAGVTPGNKQFVDLWEEKFQMISVTQSLPLNPENSYRQFNVVHWNLYDFVPYAWTHLQGPDFLDWAPYDKEKPEEMHTKLGLCVDQACIEAHKLYEEHQGWAMQCALQKPRPYLFIGKWPVPFWDETGMEQTYPGPHPSPMTNDQLMQAKGMAHMGQYLLRAGINPHDIPPAVRPAAQSARVRAWR